MISLHYPVPETSAVDMVISFYQKGFSNLNPIDNLNLNYLFNFSSFRCTASLFLSQGIWDHRKLRDSARNDFRCVTRPCSNQVEVVVV